MRKILASLALLIAAPATAQQTVDAAGHVALRDPNAHTNVTIGTLGPNGFRPSPVTTGNPDLPAGVYGLPTDGLNSVAAAKLHVNLTGTRSSPTVAQTIEVLDGQTGPASGPNYSTGGSAAYGLGITVQRPSWNTSAITGEIDGASIFVRQSNGDTAGVLSNVGARNGFAAFTESLTSSFASDGSQTKAVNVQTGVVNSRDGGEYGVIANAAKGANLSAAIRVADTANGNWQYGYYQVNAAGREMSTIDDAGNTYLAGTLKSGATNWLEATIPGTESIAQGQSISTRGFIGQLGACRTSDSTQTGSQGCQGLSGFALNDNTTQLQSVYAGYLEARRYAGAGITQGLEVNPLNGGSTVDESPYAMNAAGLTEAYRASAGRGDTSLNNPVSAAFVIVPNGATFRRGIICSAGALDPAGPNDCLAMASGQRITWYTGAGSMVGGTMYGGIGATGTSGEVDLAAVSSTNVAVRCSLMGFGNNSLACDSGLDLGLPASRFNHVYASYLNLAGPAPTGSSSTPCTVGDQSADANYIYVCTAPNHWRRAALGDY